MSEEDKTKLFSYNQKLDNNSEYSIPSEIIQALLDNNYSNITIDISASPKLAAIEAGFSENQFDKIQEIQSLPEKVVYDFLSIKGTMNGSDFMERVLHNAG